MSKTLWKRASAAVERIDAWADTVPSFGPDGRGRWRWYHHGGWGCRWQLWGRFDNWLEASGRTGHPPLG
jgi:hypothetical protein